MRVFAGSVQIKVVISLQKRGYFRVFSSEWALLALHAHFALDKREKKKVHVLQTR